MQQQTETHGTLMRAVKKWCTEHGGRFDRVGRTSLHGLLRGAWIATVVMDDGIIIESISHDQARVIEGLTKNLRLAREGDDGDVQVARVTSTDSARSIETGRR